MAECLILLLTTWYTLAAPPTLHIIPYCHVGAVVVTVARRDVRTTIAQPQVDNYNHVVEK